MENIVCEPNYFSLNSDYCPIHLALLDEVVSNHPLLHSTVLQLYTTLFEGSYGEMEILAALEIKKMLVDRLVNLLSRGYVLTVRGEVHGPVLAEHRHRHLPHFTPVSHSPTHQALIPRIV